MPRRPFLLPLATLLFPTLTLAQTLPNSAASHLAGLLANDARDALRNPDLPPDAAATQAAILLQCAHKLDSADLRILHLLAQTAQAAGRPAVQRDALRNIISADTGDLVAQVHYIELLADDSQNAEDRMAVYRGTLAKTELDPQVRSEIALRLARLAEGRGEGAACRDYLAQSVKLNSVNIGALRDLVRLAAAEPAGPEAFNHQLQSLVALLTANPYQADAWLQVANICQSANVHDRAAEFLQTTVEQFQKDGSPVNLDLLLDLALEFAVAGKRPEAFNVAAGLSQLPEAPLALLLLAELLAQEGVPATLPQAGTQPVQRLPEIRKRLAELAKETDNPAALADAAGADLTILSTPGPDTAAWVEAYAKLVKPEDTTLPRLQGWLLYRQGKLAQAQAVLKDATDPLAQVCLARVLLDQNQASQAKILLQELWNGNPTGLLALQITLAARKAGLTLADSASGKTVRPLIARLTSSVSGMHRTPSDAQLIGVNFRKVAVGPGEAVPLQVRITNTTDHPLPVGADGVVKSTIGLEGATLGPSGQELGLYAIEDLQRVYRLEARQMMETTIRVDQGRLGDLLAQNLGTFFMVNVSVITAPRVLSSKEFSAGVGGQAIGAGDFQRSGLALNAPAELQKLTQDLTSLTGDAQLIRIEAATALLAKAPIASLSAALAALARNPDPVVRATLVRAVPLGASEELERSVQALSTDPDSLVRLLWACRQARIAESGGDAGKTAVAALEKLAAGEKDESLKDWMATALPLAKAAATRPTPPPSPPPSTSPTTAPATSPGTP